MKLSDKCQQGAKPLKKLGSITVLSVFLNFTVHPLIFKNDLVTSSDTLNQF